MNRHNNGSAASVEAELCTQSKCTNCSNLLYDEEVMAGWTSNDSNLKTRLVIFFHSHWNIGSQIMNRCSVFG